MNQVSFSRVELYNLVWRFPIITITKEYGISSMELNRACAIMRVPLPPSCYWKKYKISKVAKPGLSEDYKGSNTFYVKNRAFKIQIRSLSKPSPLNRRTAIVEMQIKHILLVSGEQFESHRLIQNTLLYHANGEIPSEDFKILKMNVSEENMPRALRFMNVFLKIIELRGHRFEQRKEKKGSIILNNGLAVDFNLRERARGTAVKPDKDSLQHISADEFIFQIRIKTCKKEWRDGMSMLEYKLAAIVAKLELMGEAFAAE